MNAEDELDKVLSKSTPRQASVAQRLVSLALTDFAFVRDKEGRAFAVLRDGLPFAKALRGGDDSIRKQLGRRFYEQSGGVVSQGGAMTDALMLLEAHAEDWEPVGIHQRVAPINGGVLVDLGRSDSQVVEVTATGWSVREALPGDPLFLRGQNIRPLPLPLPDGTLEPLWRVLNVRPADQPMLVGWMVATFLPRVPQPILLLRGEEGAGKTSAAKILLSFLEPGGGDLTSPPRSEKNWAVSASDRTVLGLDNVSVIPPWLSDVFCRAVTGDAVVSRALYSDGRKSILTVQVALIITSVDPGALKGDLAGRILPIELEPITIERLEEEVILAECEDNAPAVLGALMDLVVLAVANRHTAQAPAGGWPRMAGYATVLAALGSLYPEALPNYLQATTDIEIDMLTGDPLVDAVLRLVDRDSPWKGTITQLLDELNLGRDLSPDLRRGWRTGAELSKSLNTLSKGLRLAGVDITRRKSGSRRLIKLKRSKLEEGVGDTPN